MAIEIVCEKIITDKNKKAYKIKLLKARSCSNLPHEYVYGLPKVDMDNEKMKIYLVSPNSYILSVGDILLEEDFEALKAVIFEAKNRLDRIKKRLTWSGEITFKF